MEFNDFIWWVGAVFSIVSFVFGAAIIVCLIIDKWLQVTGNVWDCAAWISDRRKQRRKK